jgi:hypothetical protein
MSGTKPPKPAPDRGLCETRIAIIDRWLRKNRIEIAIRATHAFAYPVVGVGLALLVVYYGGLNSTLWRSVLTIASGGVSSFFIRAPFREIFACLERNSDLDGLRKLYLYAMKRGSKIDPDEFSRYEELFWNKLKGRKSETG